MTIFDLGPAAAEFGRVAGGVTGDRLGDPTPCPDWPVGALLQHVLQLAGAFTGAAGKAPSGAAPEPDPDLPDDWPDQLQARLDGLVEAWRDPAAWEGEATVGGVTLPAGMVAAVGVDELVVHGWDLARATGQSYSADPGMLRVATGFAERFADLDGGPFGPSLPAAGGDDELTRLLRLTGRNPTWTP